MDKVLRMTYASSLTNLCEINSSFDTGILRICYPGENRNGSYIDKSDIERCLPTIFNCPIVCNYDRESETLGGHDIDVIRDGNGSLHIVNATQPVGVIPESARVWFEDYEEQDGTIHEYLYAEVLIWKRQEAYRKIKEDGITMHSMEIGVKDGETIDNVFHIRDFEFTAFTLIGVEPCFESSALEMFTKETFKQQFSEMMHDLKEATKQVTTSQEVDNIHPQNYSMEGGTKVLKTKTELIAEYGIDTQSLDFSIDDFTVEELIEKFEAIKNAQSGAGEDGASGGETGGEPQSKFELTGNVVDELMRVLEEEKIEREWGIGRRYCYVDCDFTLTEVYFWDCTDWLLYGCKYEISGDSISIDFKCKKRKKYSITDFDDGEQPSPFAPTFELVEKAYALNAGWEAKYQTASDTITNMQAELDTLRKFKTDAENAVAQAQRDEIFAQFEDLSGVEAFENLRTNCADYDTETLEEKCYAIRGRAGVVSKFSLEGKTPKLKVDKADQTKEPYGGLFVKYNIGVK